MPYGAVHICNRTVPYGILIFDIYFYSYFLTISLNRSLPCIFLLHRKILLYPLLIQFFSNHDHNFLSFRNWTDSHLLMCGI